MRPFIDAARAAVASGNFYAALMVALTLPDICAASVEPKARAGDRYRAWWTKYCEPKHTSEWGGERHVFLGAGDAYALRCAVLHQGFDDVGEHNAREALDTYKFVQPHRGGYHRIKVGRHLVLQVSQLVEEICRSAEEFLEDVKSDETAQDRLSKQLFIDPVPNGLRF